MSTIEPISLEVLRQTEITQTATTNPPRIDRAGMIVLIVLALAIVGLMTRPAKAPVCVEVTPVMGEAVGE